MQPYVRLIGTTSFFNFFKVILVTKSHINFVLSKILLHILCKVTSFLSFPHKTSSLNLRSHASQYQIILYVLFYCRGFFCCILENFSMFSAHAIFSYLFNFFGSNVGFRKFSPVGSAYISPSSPFFAIKL